MDKPQRYSKTVRVEAPFPVVDAVTYLWIAEAIVPHSSQRLGYDHQILSSGSSRYKLLTFSKPLWLLSLLAVDHQNTLLQFTLFNYEDETRDEDDSEEIIAGYLTAFGKWFYEYQSSAVNYPDIKTFNTPLVPGITERLADNVPKPKRPGPPPAADSIWVKEQLALGRILEEMLPEFMKRRGEDQADEEQLRKSHENLRKTIERTRKRTG